jgi:hypothetical protein
LTKEEAIDRARRDLAQRLGVEESQIKTVSMTEATYPDSALGAYLEDEMAADVLTEGGRIILSGPDGVPVEYRGTEKQLRLFNFHGENFKL